MSEAIRKRPDLRGWVVPAALLLLWWLASDQDWVDGKLVASPVAVLAAAWQAAASGELWQSLAASLGRNLSGFVLGSLAAWIEARALAWRTGGR